MHMPDLGVRQTRDFHYPNQWYNRSDRNGPPDRSLILSDLFQVVHVATDTIIPAALARYRSDRLHEYMVIGRLPSTSPDDPLREALEQIQNRMAWVAGGCGWSERTLCLFESHRELFYDWRYYLPANADLYRMRSLPTHLWLAAAIGLRHNGFDFHDF
jgi:hypothetical protein